MKPATFCLLSAVAVLYPVRADAASSCESLTSFSQPTMAVTLAQNVAAGQFTTLRVAAVVEKPFDAEHLLAVVRQVLNQGPETLRPTT